MEIKYSKEAFLDGQVLLINKPIESTSFAIVIKIRNLIKRTYGLRKIKVGHAGTLDPLASGLLIVCTGKYTKKISEFQGLDKTYTGTIQLDITTPSFDFETEPDASFDLSGLNDEKIYETIKTFTGEIDQTPPIFSAKKINGIRAYEYARNGEELEQKSVKIKINDFKITKIYLPYIDFFVNCTKGTYIRSLARDFGKELGVGGTLRALCRTNIGEYNLDEAISLETFKEEIFKNINEL